MSKRSKRPKTPAQIAAELAAAQERRAREQAKLKEADRALEWGIETDTALPAQADVAVTPATRGGKAAAERMDAFRALKPGMPAADYTAVRKLEGDMLLRRGETWRGAAVAPVDGGERKPRVITMAEAGERVDAALAQVGDRDAWLLTWLIAPPAENALRFQTWREVVAYITGETHEHAQGAAVRAACANLARAYERRMAA